MTRIIPLGGSTSRDRKNHAPINWLAKSGHRVKHKTIGTGFVYAGRRKQQNILPLQSASQR
jgi:hypothetical protein